MANELKQFITLDSAIQLGMMISGESNNPNSYARFKYFALQAMNELTWDVLRNFKGVLVGVDQTTKTVKLPDDFVQWTRVGFIDQENEIQDLAYDPNLAFTPTIENCNEVSKHCSCGCTDPVCAAVSNAETTTEDVVINGTTYQKTTTVCVKSDGDVVKRICEPVVTNPEKECTYTLSADDFNSITFPIKDAYFTINGAAVNIGYCLDADVFHDVMLARGFTYVVSFPHYYYIEDSSDVYTSITYTGTQAGQEGEIFILPFEQSSCVQPTPTVETVCYDEFQCKVDVKDCGCIEVTQETVNTLASVGILVQEFLSRFLNASDWLQTFKQPPSYFGYFNINIYTGIMQLDPTFPFQSVYIQYYSSNEVDGGDYLIPAFAKDSIAWYCKWLYSESRNNVPNSTKDRNERKWLQKKRLLRERFNPIRLEQILPLMRMSPRP